MVPFLSYNSGLINFDSYMHSRLCKVGQTINSWDYANKGINCEANVLCVMTVISKHRNTCSFNALMLNRFGKIFSDLIRTEGTVGDTWESLREMYIASVTQKRVWASRVMSVLWSLWRQRNKVIFRDSKAADLTSCK